jgi:hypothetical protein
MTPDNQPQTARDTHHDANMLREHDQDFPASLARADQAMAEYAAEGNAYGIAEALCTRVLTLRHMADATEQDAFRIQALHEAMAAVEIAEKASVSMAIPLQNLAKVQRELGDNDGALESFRRAADAQRANPHPTQDRPGVLANFEEMLATAELMAGDDSALERAEAALAALEAADEDAYNKAVWLSHGHGRIAAALVDRNPEVARRHYEIARDMIRSNPELKLSLGKLERLEAAFASGE